MQSYLKKKLEEKIYEDRVLEKFTSAMKQEVSFDWVKCSCPLHCHVLIEQVLKSVCLIGIPWWCKRQNRTNAEQLRKQFLEKQKSQTVKVQLMET